MAEDAIPRIYFAKPYFVAATKGSEKAYALLRDTLQSMHRVALAQVVIHTRQYVAAVYPFEGVMIAQLLRYDEEVYKKPADIGVEPPKGASATRAPELAMAKKLVEGMEVEWAPKEYRDEYRDDLLALVKKRAKGAKLVHEAPDEQKKGGKEPKVLDLMEALRRSVSEQGSAGRTRKSAAHAKRTRRSA